MEKKYSDENNIYTCSFCEKKEKGKPLNWLYPSARVKYTGEPVPLNGTEVSLMPHGWQWDIQPISFKDLWSCGCHKLR